MLIWENVQMCVLPRRNQAAEEAAWCDPICVQGRWHCSSRCPSLGENYIPTSNNIGLPMRLASISDMGLEVTCATSMHRL